MTSKRSPKRSFGQITKLRSKRFQARYADPQGRTTLSRSGRPTLVLHTAPVTFETRQDAEGWLTDERRLISSGDWTSPAARRQAATRREATRKANGFDTYARAWLNSRHDLRPTTRASYETSLTRHLIPAFGSTPITDIDTAMVRNWFQSYGSRTPTARAHAFAVLKAVLGQAEDDGLIQRNPARIKGGGRAPAKREPQVLTLAELLALADAMPAKHKALTLLCGLCGLRFGEAVALRRADVDLVSGVVHVQHGVTRVRGEKVVGKPKTKASIRTVAMPQLVVEAMREHLGRSMTGGRSGLVFPGEDGQPLAPSALYGGTARIERRNGKVYPKAAYGFYAAREAIGRPELHWHDLRRTAATLGAQSGATVREMQHRLGAQYPGDGAALPACERRARPGHRAAAAGGRGRAHRRAVTRQAESRRMLDTAWPESGQASRSRTCRTGSCSRWRSGVIPPCERPRHMTRQPVPPRYASLEDAARYAGCSTRTLRRRIADGSLRGFRFGPKLLRVDLTEVDRLFAPVPTGSQASDGAA